MSELVFRVRGQHLVRHAPERAVVHLGVRSEDPDASAAGARVREVTEQVRDDLSTHPGISAVHVGQFRIWSQPGDAVDVPTNEIAEVEVRVVVEDFTDMGELLLRLGSVSEVNIGWIDWQLTDATRRETERLARREALADAHGRAEDYASALGVSDLVTVLVADGGMMHGIADRVAFAAKEAGAGPDFFTPQEIEVTADVEVEYTAAT